MAESVSKNILHHVGYAANDVEWFTHLVIDKVDLNSCTWESMIDIFKDHNFSSLYHEFDGQGLRFSRDVMESPTLTNLFSFVSLLVYMEIEGVDSFSEMQNRTDIIECFKDGELLPPTMVDELVLWMERISCPVVGMNGTTKTSQFSACSICGVHSLCDVWDFNTLLRSLEKMSNSSCHAMLSLEAKRSLIKATRDVIGNGECVSLTRHNPLIVPMNELEQMLRKLNISHATIFCILDIVGPRCYLNRLIECKASVNARKDIAQNDLAAFMKAIVYMESNDCCEAIVDKFSEFPVSEFREWASNHDYVS